MIKFSRRLPSRYVRPTQLSFEMYREASIRSIEIVLGELREFRDNKRRWHIHMTIPTDHDICLAVENRTHRCIGEMICKDALSLADMVYIRDGGRCRVCRRFLNPYSRGSNLPADSERHHIKPICEGGSNDLDNLVLLCHFCHKLGLYDWLQEA